MRRCYRFRARGVRCDGLPQASPALLRMRERACVCACERCVCPRLHFLSRGSRSNFPAVKIKSFSLYYFTLCPDYNHSRLLLLQVYEYTVGNHLMAAVGPGQIMYSTFVTQYSFMFIRCGPFERNTVGYNNTRELLRTIIDTYNTSAKMFIDKFY